MNDNEVYPVRATRTFPGVPQECGAARAWAKTIVQAFPEISDAVELVTSELFANAVRHTASGIPGGEVEVAVTMTGDRPECIRLEVTDQGRRPDRPWSVPHARMPSEDSQGGRGLFIASALSREWGRFPVTGSGAHHLPGQAHDRPGSMITWAEFPVHQIERDLELAGAS
ncbi:ATP-binding protein [Nocardiopsis ansamitocini]|uniref:Histidine kinase/HSP90-like ATPase domain-containing protein n=1 Tax=Nocardiopsis ansamitocini TaxID=1670832 RepID=A0A9W6P4W8_9ACTN|nr:ATP-binding protein [Nocardiopsis ansamitocini]GLU47157.1 hypothetical protein Nans01_15080 [Nocardiopsis ansamitocini]